MRHVLPGFKETPEEFNVLTAQDVNDLLTDHPLWKAPTDGLDERVDNMRSIVVFTVHFPGRVVPWIWLTRRAAVHDINMRRDQEVRVVDVVIPTLDMEVVDGKLFDLLIVVATALF